MNGMKIAGVLSAALLLAACGSARHDQNAPRVQGSQTAAASGSACTLLKDYGGKGKNVVYRCSGAKLLALPEVRNEIHPEVGVSFSAGGRVVKNNLESRPVARAFAKDDEGSCARAFVNGVRRFQETAQKWDADRVSDLHSFAAGSDGRFTRKLLPSGQFDCIVATFQSRMVMRGDVAN